MKTLDNKLIIYDSNCKVCSFMKDLLVRITSIKENKVVAYKKLSTAMAAKVKMENFKNGMALVDTGNEETIYGSEGIAYIFSSQNKLFNFLFKSQAFVLLFDFLYKVISYNRYIIALPKSKYDCDCYPDNVSKYRVGYIAISIFISIVLTVLFGMSLRDFVGAEGGIKPGLSLSQAGGQMLLMAGTGWVFQIITALFLMKNKALEYIGHLGSIMVVGLLILVPWMIFYAIPGILNMYLPIVSVFVSSIVCFICIYIEPTI